MKTMIDNKFDMSSIESEKVIMLSAKKNSISTHKIEETKMLLEKVLQIMECEKTFNVRLLGEYIQEQYPDFNILDYFPDLFVSVENLKKQVI